MLKAEYIPYSLEFIKTARTSRAVMNYKDTYFIKIYDTENSGKCGIGEVALFKGLSAEDNEQFESILAGCCERIDSLRLEDIEIASIRFGVETALSDLANGGVMKPFSVAESYAIPINGLVWMGDFRTMCEEMKMKLDAGFRCIKLKIGGIDFDDEIALLRQLRQEFSQETLEIRVDANGAFSPQDALGKIDRLSKYAIHSIEQPIRQHQAEAMADICRKTSIAVALDEELIGMTPDLGKEELLDSIMPQYIILKPSLCGGFSEADHWINAAEKRKIGWWATSALESNIGLNAIARWLLKYDINRPQGLGTGALYRNNITSPLEMIGDRLTFDNKRIWDISTLGF